MSRCRTRRGRRDYSCTPDADGDYDGQGDGDCDYGGHGNGDDDYMLEMMMVIMGEGRS